MHRRIALAGLAATGGLLTTAFLQTAVAFADTGADVVSATGADAFTIGSYTFDPFTVPVVNGVPGAIDGLAPTGVETEGFAGVDPFSSAPPLLTLGGGTVGPVSTASQYLEVYNASGTDLGSIDAGENVTKLAGLTNTEFTVNDVFPATGQTDAALPTVGSVYDSLNLGNGYDNVYTATPGSSGTVTDTLVTPYGNENLSSLFGNVNAAAPLHPGDAFTGLADNAVAKDAFAIGGYTLDPQTVNASGTAVRASPRSLHLPRAAAAQHRWLSLSDPAVAGDGLDTQSFDVYDGTGRAPLTSDHHH